MPAAKFGIDLQKDRVASGADRRDEENDRKSRRQQKRGRTMSSNPLLYLASPPGLEPELPGVKILKNSLTPKFG
jgi:hypothetical protein